MASDPFDLTPFRGYLLLLARVGLDRRLRRAVDPSDIVQQTLLEAHQAQPRFEGETFEQRAAWLRRILARNLADLARDQRRAKRDVERERSLEEALAGSSLRLASCLAASGPTPSEAAIREERVLALADAVVSLPPDQQEVVVRRHCLGSSLEEIAGELGKSEASVAGLLRRGLKSLRENLERRG